jgi:hypothetical protein
VLLQLCRCLTCVNSPQAAVGVHCTCCPRCCPAATQICCLLATCQRARAPGRAVTQRSASCCRCGHCQQTSSCTGCARCVRGAAAAAAAAVAHGKLPVGCHCVCLTGCVTCRSQLQTAVASRVFPDCAHLINPCCCCRSGVQQGGCQQLLRLWAGCLLQQGLPEAGGAHQRSTAWVMSNCSLHAMMLLHNAAVWPLL